MFIPKKVFTLGNPSHIYCGEEEIFLDKFKMQYVELNNETLTVQTLLYSKDQLAIYLEGNSLTLSAMFYGKEIFDYPRETQIPWRPLSIPQILQGGGVK